MTKLKKGNMYGDSVFQWNVFKGCLFKCDYCIPSFQKQAKRHNKICKYKSDIINPKTNLPYSKCYTYEPHFHEERLNINFNLKKYETTGDQFIWACSSGDVSFMRPDNMIKVLDVIRKFSNRTFFMQSKDPKVFQEWYMDPLPDNLIVGTTFETNRDTRRISKAPYTGYRALWLSYINARRSITIEPILDFDMEPMIKWIKRVEPERVYIGYDTKNCGLPEPTLQQTVALIEVLEQSGIKVKIKLLREGNHE